MTLEDMQARLTSLGLKLPESDHKPLLDMVGEIERASATVREGLSMPDEMAVVFATDRLGGGAA
jgi:hypothetical protein